MEEAWVGGVVVAADTAVVVAIEVVAVARVMAAEETVAGAMAAVEMVAAENEAMEKRVAAVQLEEMGAH